jgi:hypothetical protein
MNIICGVTMWEWIDRAQDVMTSIAIPIAVYLLWKIYIKVHKDD